MGETQQKPPIRAAGDGCLECDMKMILFILVLFYFEANSQSHSLFISAGLDYRTYPLDIENVPPGPSSTTPVHWPKHLFPVYQPHSDFL